MSSFLPAFAVVIILLFIVIALSIIHEFTKSKKVLYATIISFILFLGTGGVVLNVYILHGNDQTFDLFDGIEVSIEGSPFNASSFNASMLDTIINDELKLEILFTNMGVRISRTFISIMELCDFYDHDDASGGIYITGFDRIVRIDNGSCYPNVTFEIRTSIDGVYWNDYEILDDDNSINGFIEPYFRSNGEHDLWIHYEMNDISRTDGRILLSNGIGPEIRIHPNYRTVTITSR